MRRLFAALSSCAVAAGVLVGVAAPARAASVSIDCEYDSQTVSVAVNETLTIGASHCTIQSTSGVGAFSPSSGYVPSTVTFASGVAGQAELTVYGAGVSPTVLTIIVGGSAGPSDPALVYPTAYLNANGGTCTGTMQFTKMNGQNDTLILPTSATCSRENYTLLGWARNADGTGDSWTPGSETPIGDESFTLYAVWEPDGIEITYGAGVSDAQDCLASGVNTNDRTETVVVPISGTLATSAPCAPASMVLEGWKDLATNRFYEPGEAVSQVLLDCGPLRVIDTVDDRCGRSAVRGILDEESPTVDEASPSSGGRTRISMAAQWIVGYDVALTPSAVAVAPGGTTTLFVTASTNGVSVPATPIAISLPADGPFTFADGQRSGVVVTDANGLGQVTVTAASEGTGTGTLTAAYGNSTSSASLTVRDETITITCAETRGKPLWTYSCTDFGEVPVGTSATIAVQVTQLSRKSHAIVPAALNLSGVNGTLVEDPQPGDCGRGVIVPGLGSCTIHYTWTPAEAGPLTSPEGSVRLVSCADGNALQCYSTSAGAGLRGTAVETVAPALVIAGWGSRSGGQSGIGAIGFGVGLRPTDAVTAWVKYEGESAFSAVPDQPTRLMTPDMGPASSYDLIRWRFATDRTVSVYFTSRDGAVRSNTIVVVPRRAIPLDLDDTKSLI